MQFKALIDVMPQKEILDPQGKAVEEALNHLSAQSIQSVRIGKKIEFFIESESKASAVSQVEELSKKLLANLIMEEFKVEVMEV
jgi:phosphoribosylformylglycinamidine synthase